MSSLRRAVQSRVHLERHQPRKRRRLGLLEHKKDYRKRARDYHRKQDQIKALALKAALRNPDEFYFGMVNAKTKGGLHRLEDLGAELTKEQMEVLKSQDASYVGMKVSQEKAKIEKLRASLHLLVDDAVEDDDDSTTSSSEEESSDVSSSSSGEGYVAKKSQGGGKRGIKRQRGGRSSRRPGTITTTTKAAKNGAVGLGNGHLVFLSDDEDIDDFDPVKYFDTVPELLNRRYNRPRRETLENEYVVAPETARARRNATKGVAKAYSELAARMKRLEQLEGVQKTLQLHRKLMAKGRKTKVRNGKKGKPPVYRWKKERKR